jgi:serine/threonine protein kinase
MPSDRTGATRPAPPSQIGRYRVLAELGRGSMGIVYAAYDDAGTRSVAVKVLGEAFEHDQDARARFLRETEIVARLRHPNIVSIFEAGEDDSRPFLAMQLLDGAPLTDYVAALEPSALQPRLDLLVQMCEGVAAAHALGVVHRDLKPGNIMVQPDGLLKILDFGVARVSGSNMTVVGTMIGTPNYMSPEQARGEVVDARSDIFSVGAVSYFILTGRDPFGGPTLGAVLQRLQSESPLPIDDAVPRELVVLVSKALEKNPAARPARIEDLLVELVKFRRGYESEILERPDSASAPHAFARLSAAQRAELEAWSAVEIGRARSAFRRDRQDEAIDQLQRAHQARPLAPDLAEELTHLQALREALRSDRDVAHPTVASLLLRAKMAQDAGRHVEAVSLARDAVSADPLDEGATSLLDTILARQLAAQIEAAQTAATAERRALSGMLRRTAEAAQRNGYVAKALQLARGAQRIDPGHAENASLIARLTAEIEADDSLPGGQSGPLSPFSVHRAVETGSSRPSASTGSASTGSLTAAPVPGGPSSSVASSTGSSAAGVSRLARALGFWRGTAPRESV